MNHAARVKSKASAGQVVVSDKTWDSCTKQDEFVELDLGKVSLKGIEERINLYQISRKVSQFGLDLRMCVPLPMCYLTWFLFP